MALHLYNTLTRKKEPFEPLHPPRVGMYVCGVTVYDECHLGHARALINFDVIYRYLYASGYDVTFVRNFTDVDDKIINRANQEKIPWDEVAQKYIATFNRDMQALGNQSPQFEPKATENIDKIIRVIERLMTQGFAYQAGADVFYSVRKKTDYGKLSGKKIDELEVGARVEVHEAKRDPLDFALWKASKPGEPAWDSPWGSGRPGWHIECSAMSMGYLGETFDIHGGGRDLTFPHHENEIAQSEAATGKPFARYWLHNGFININAEKMSKSLGNFLTIHELLKKYHPEVLRCFILSAHYRSPLDYTEENVGQARASLIRWYETMQRIYQECAQSQSSVLPQELQQKIDGMTGGVRHAMDDDFNTAKVMGQLFDLIRTWNKALDEGRGVARALCQRFLDQVRFVDSIFGVFGSDPEVFLAGERERALGKTALSAETIEAKLKERADARKTKDWARADAIRKELDQAGIQFKDNPDGTTTWHFN